MIRNIIPTPKNVVFGDGEINLSGCVYTNQAQWVKYIEVLQDAFKKLFQVDLTVGEGGIKLVYAPSLDSDEYSLECEDDIVLCASSDEGILYAMASLIQAIVKKDGILTMERVKIKDRPDKSYRTLMIDLAREWHPLNNILKYIDLCFYMKVKYLHLHFIDNQRYTLPSIAFPHITDGNMFYSYEEIIQLREYASKRGIIIVPEFEAPGHAVAMIKNYPEIFSNDLGNEDCSITTESGAVIKADSIVCAGNPKTIEAIGVLLKEISELFPESPYIHIGGDEANIKAWNYCSVCKKYMEDNGIEDVYELYSEFVGRVAKIVFDLGRTPIVWEGFPKKGVKYIPKETIVIAWESHYHMAYDLLNEGFRIINGSWQPLYIVPSLNHRWNIPDILGWNVYNWQHWWEKSEATLNPINVVPTDMVIGAQMSVWECNFEQEISRVVENISAFTERTWNEKRTWSDSQFIARCYETIRRAFRFIQDV